MGMLQVERKKEKEGEYCYHEHGIQCHTARMKCEKSEKNEKYEKREERK